MSDDLSLEASSKASPSPAGPQRRNRRARGLAQPQGDGSGVVGARGKRQDVTRRPRIARILARFAAWLLADSLTAWATITQDDVDAGVDAWGRLNP